MLGSEDTFTKNTAHFEYPDLEFFRGLSSLFWASIIGIGIAVSSVTGFGSKTADGSNSNPTSNPLGNLFGGSEKSSGGSSSKSAAANSNVSQHEAMRRQMQMANSRAPQIGGNNSPMAQGSQATNQAIQEQLERQRRQALVRSSNSGKPSQK
jgi:hypothetical protein